MAHHAAGVPRFLLQEDRLDAGLVEIVVEGGLCLWLGAEARGRNRSEKHNRNENRRTAKNHGPPPSTLLFLAERLAERAKPRDGPKPVSIGPTAGVPFIVADRRTTRWRLMEWGGCRCHPNTIPPRT